VVFVMVVSAGTYGLSTLKPAPPPVDRAFLWSDKVKRGPLLFDIHGTGSLVAEEFRWIPATRAGLIEKVNVRIGDTVGPGTIIAGLSNPDLLQSLTEAELAIKVAEAEFASTRAAHQSAAINQQIQLANLEHNEKRLQLDADTEDELAKNGLTSQLTVRRAHLAAENAAGQVQQEKQRLGLTARANAAEITAREARLDQLRAALELKKFQVEGLNIRAGVSGVLQQVSIEVGQRVSAGASVAKIADPHRLKAQLRIAETQAKDLMVGQAASIDTRNGIVPGRVTHVDPVAIEGTVTVDVQLEGDLPRGARPDLRVDGTIEIERLSDVLYVGRPPNGKPNSTIQMFKVLPDADAARVAVRVGKVSVNSIQILEGLEEGDEVILSDMSAYDAHDQIRLR
jgi:HlyD family secretion protein